MEIGTSDAVSFVTCKEEEDKFPEWKESKGSQPQLWGAVDQDPET